MRYPPFWFYFPLNHTLYLFWIAAALWVYQTRNWRIVFGAAAIGSIAALFPMLFDGAIYYHYLEVYQSTYYLAPFDLPVPTLRNVLKLLLMLDGPIFEQLPTAAGILWMLFYWHRNKQKWQWAESLPLILIVSVMTSPYAWTYDTILILPAIIQAFSWLGSNRNAALVVYLLFNGAYLGARYIVPVDFWYFWMTPFFLAVYLLVKRRCSDCSLTAALSES